MGPRAGSRKPDHKALDRFLRDIVTCEYPPHQILVTLLRKLLHWTSTEIVQQSSRTLCDLERETEEELQKAWHQYGLDAQYISSHLGPLRVRLATVGATPLANHYASHDSRERATEVRRWCQSVLSVIAVRTLPKGPQDDYQSFDQLLQIVVTSENPPHQILVALLVKLLEWTPALVVAAASRTLWELEQHIETQLENAWAPYGLSARYVRSRLEPLRVRLASVGSTQLGEYFKNAAQVSSAWYSTMRHAWVSFPVLSAIRRTAASALPHWALAFAHVHGLGWEAHRIVKHRSPCSLTMITQDLEGALLKDKKLPRWLVREALDPLRTRLALPVGELLDAELDSPSLDLSWRLAEVLLPRWPLAESELPNALVTALYGVPEPLLHCSAGDTHLCEYFTDLGFPDPPADCGAVTEDEKRRRLAGDKDLQIVLWSRAAAQRVLKMEDQPELNPPQKLLSEIKHASRTTQEQ